MRGFKKHILPLFVLLVICLIVMRHSLVHPTTSFGMSSGDTEGTMWWIWTKCKGYNSGSLLNHISEPIGFDISQLPVYNLVDQLRIWMIGLFDCSTSSVILSISLLPISSLVLNTLVSYTLGFQLFRSIWAGTFVALSCSFSSQVLLATRTSLSNNFLAPGLLALVFTVIFLRKGSAISLLGILTATAVQVLCNVYNGALFIFLSITFILFFPSLAIKKFINRLYVSVTILGVAILGLIPLMSSQLYLLSVW